MGAVKRMQGSNLTRGVKAKSAVAVLADTRAQHCSHWWRAGKGTDCVLGGVHTVDTVYRRRSCARRRIRMRQGLLKHVTPKKSRTYKHTATECVCYYNYQKPNLELLLRGQGVYARLRFPMYTLLMNTVENCYVWMRIVETRIVCITPPRSHSWRQKIRRRDAELQTWEQALTDHQKCEGHGEHEFRE